MKRLIIAVIILAGVAVVSILSLNVQLSNTEYLLGELEEIQQAYDEGNRELCLTLSTEFVKTFESRTRIFPLFMRHADIGAIRESVAPLPGMTDTSPPSWKSAVSSWKHCTNRKLPLYKISSNGFSITF